VRRHGRSRALAANQSSNAVTSFACAAPEFDEGGLAFGFEFKNIKDSRTLLFNRQFNSTTNSGSDFLVFSIRKGCSPLGINCGFVWLTSRIA
jgi:hypothetical protein